MPKHAHVSDSVPERVPEVVLRPPSAEAGRAHVRLPETRPPKSACAEWLDWQCRMISGTLHGELHLLASGETSFDPPVIWPADGEALATLPAIAVQAVNERRRLIFTARSDQHLPGEVIACPVQRSGEITGVVLLVLKPRNELQVRAVAQLLEWGIAWLESLLVVVPDAGATSPAVVNHLQCLLSAPSMKRGAEELSNHIAHQYGIDRVSLGVRHALRMHVQAISGDAVGSDSSALLTAIESAMTEAADQDFTTPYPVTGQPNLAHRGLLQQHGMTAVISLPLRMNDELIGVLTLESTRTREIPKGTVAALMDAAPLLAPALALLASRERSWAHRLRPWVPTSQRSKRVLAAVTILLIAASLLPVTFRVGGPATVEGIGQRAISATLDGIIASAPARAGDELPAGAVLATLEDRDLSIQQARWSSERDRYAKEYGDALVRRERAGAGIARTHMQQAEAELGLVSAQIERATLRTPFAGIVVSGDYSQLLGTPVSRGQVMFEIAPAGDHRVIVEVDERNIGVIAAGANGHLRLAGLPHERLAITVTRIDPVASVSEGNNRFRVEARLDATPSAIRPGMQGVARFDAGTRPLIWTWIYDLVSGVRIWFWRMGL